MFTCKTMWPNFVPSFCACYAMDQSSFNGVAIREVYFQLWTYFTFYGANGPELSTTLYLEEVRSPGGGTRWTTTVSGRVHQNAALRAKSAVYDYHVYLIRLCQMGLLQRSSITSSLFKNSERDMNIHLWAGAVLARAPWWAVSEGRPVTGKNLVCFKFEICSFWHTCKAQTSQNFHSRCPVTLNKTYVWRAAL